MSHATARRIRRAAVRQGAKRKSYKYRRSLATGYTKRHTKLRKTY